MLDDLVRVTLLHSEAASQAVALEVTDHRYPLKDEWLFSGNILLIV
jgi:hypothetical protein